MHTCTKGPNTQFELPSSFSSLPFSFLPSSLYSVSTCLKVKSTFPFQSQHVRKQGQERRATLLPSAALSLPPSSTLSISHSLTYSSFLLPPPPLFLWPLITKVHSSNSSPCHCLLNTPFTRHLVRTNTCTLATSVHDARVRERGRRAHNEQGTRNKEQHRTCNTQHPTQCTIAFCHTFRWTGTFSNSLQYLHIRYCLKSLCKF